MILGGQAVGKIIVGEELAKITPYKLFHNYMTVEIQNPFYGFKSNSSDPVEVSKKVSRRN